MKSGYRRREEAAEPETGEDAGLSPADYYARPNQGRRQLTERDLQRNKGVDRLFDSVRPGLPIDADPAETRVEPIPISVCMERLLTRLGVGESPWVAELSAKWAEVVGADLAAVCHPGKWDSTRRILYVYVDNAPKLFELRMTKARFVEAKVRAFAPEHGVAAVRFMQRA